MYPAQAKTRRRQPLQYLLLQLEPLLASDSVPAAVRQKLQGQFESWHGRATLKGSGTSPTRLAQICIRELSAVDDARVTPLLRQLQQRVGTGPASDNTVFDLAAADTSDRNGDTATHTPESAPTRTIPLQSRLADAQAYLPDSPVGMPTEFEALRQAILEDYRPRTQASQLYVDDLVGAQWQIKQLNGLRRAVMAGVFGPLHDGTKVAEVWRAQHSHRRAQTFLEDLEARQPSRLCAYDQREIVRALDFKLPPDHEVLDAVPSLARLGPGFATPHYRLQNALRSIVRAPKIKDAMALLNGLEGQARDLLLEHARACCVAARQAYHAVAMDGHLPLQLHMVYQAGAMQALHDASDSLKLVDQQLEQAHKRHTHALNMLNRLGHALA